MRDLLSIAVHPQAAQSCGHAFDRAACTWRLRGVDRYGCARAVLTVNAGSSSLKLRLVDDDGSLLASAELPAQTQADEHALREALEGMHNAEAIAHRVVHGNRHLAYALGADLASADAARILRVPGTLSHKSQPPTAVEAIRS